MDLKGLAKRMLNMPENSGEGDEKEVSLGGKYGEKCALCGNIGTDKKWMGQFWHKKCVRVARKQARSFV